MNGRERPCENSTANTAILLSDYALAQGMCLYLLRSGFSVGLHRAKTTEVRAKWCPCPQTHLPVPKPLGGCHHLLPTENSMNGEVRPYENPTTNIAVLPLVYFFYTRHVPIPVEVGFLGRAAPRQDNGDLC